MVDFKKLKELRNLSFGKAKDNLLFKYYWNEYLKEQTQQVYELEICEAIDNLVSRVNYLERIDLKSNLETGVDICVGDICYIDFGETRLHEVGYQHMGLVLSIMNRKIFVVPFTGNQLKFVEAQSIDNPIGKRHLIQIPKLKGLTKKSVAIINDAKWINSARVIDVKSHLHPESDLFQFIKQKVKDII